MIYEVKTSLEDLEKYAAKNPKSLTVYAVHTCWWCCWELTPSGMYFNELRIPTDPRGSVLFQCNDLAGFLQTAKDNPQHYGRHGLDAFIAAYHGNIFTEGNKPTCFNSWDQYNDLIDVATKGQK